jgi:hypothetical protein
MNTSKKKVSLVIPSIADILFISILFYLSFVGTKGLLGDGDTGYHIRAGEFIIDTLSVPKHDMFSFLTPPLPWTAHEWLSEVIMAVLYRTFGLNGVYIFFAVLISSIYYLFFQIIKTYKGNILIAVVVVLLVISSSRIHWLARPHIFSLVFTVIWYYLLDSYQYNNKNYLYLFPPIMLIWVNLHGGYITAYIITGIYLAGNAVKFFISKDAEREEYKKKTRLLGLTVIACLLVTLINPYGYHILLFPFKLTSNKMIMDNVKEFLSPNFHKMMFFTYLLFLMITIIAVSRKRLNFIETILILLFTYMALYSVRYIPLFAIIVAPILVRQADHLINNLDGKFKKFLKKRAERIASVDSSAKGYQWPLTAVLFVIVIAAVGNIEYRFDEETKPVAAVEFLKKEHLRGNMFNNDEFGDYLIYAAWPEYKVFFDGRSDMYGEEMIKEYFKIVKIKPEFDDVLNKYDIKWIFFNARSTLSRYLLMRDDWKLIYADKVANIFLKDIPENRVLIEKYRNIKPVAEKSE